MPMRKRLVVVFAIVGLLSVLFVAIPDDPKVSVEDYDRIQGGMRLRQVECIFGGPAAAERDLGWKPGQGDFFRAGARILIWDGYEGHAGVTFDIKGNVLDKSYTPRNPETRRGFFVRRFDRLSEWCKRLTSVRE
jgi:hypothetical protein